METARAIAKKCGIISQGDGFLVMEGKEFSKKVTSPDGVVRGGRGGGGGGGPRMDFY